jgi:hypothetical protein
MDISAQQLYNLQVAFYRTPPWTTLIGSQIPQLSSFGCFSPMVGILDRIPMTYPSLSGVDWFQPRVIMPTGMLDFFTLGPACYQLFAAVAFKTSRAPLITTLSPQVNSEAWLAGNVGTAPLSGYSIGDSSSVGTLASTRVHLWTGVAKAQLVTDVSPGGTDAGQSAASGAFWTNGVSPVQQLWFNLFNAVIEAENALTGSSCLLGPRVIAGPLNFGNSLVWQTGTVSTTVPGDPSAADAAHTVELSMWCSTAKAVIRSLTVGAWQQHIPVPVVASAATQVSGIWLLVLLGLLVLHTSS